LIRAFLIVDCDLLITGDLLIDPLSGFKGHGQIAISNKRIVAFGAASTQWNARQVLDTTGQIVCPGLIDLHVHAYEWVTNFGLPADDAGIHSGATTIVDQGSAGAWTVGGFKGHIADRAKTDVRCFVSANLAGALQGGMEGTTLHSPDMTRVDELVRVANEYPDFVKGIKSHAESGGLSHWGTTVLEMALVAANQADLPIYVHTGELFPVNEATRPSAETVLQKAVSLLRPGDTLAHVYSAMPDGIMGQSQSIPPAVFEALEKGIHFDIGYGLNFSYAIASRMLEAGILPHTISSDVHADFNGYHDDSKLDYSLCGVMTRLLGLGMSLEDIIARTTYHPAQLIHEENEIGTLAVGSRADITILDCEQGPWTLSDGQTETLNVNQRLIPAWVIRAGELIEPNQRLLRDVCHPLSTAGNG
jgi:dihydroorotase